MSLTNPMTTLFWLGIYGSVLAETAVKSSPLQLLINSAAIVIGILLWDVFMAVIASSFRSFLSDRLLKAICIVSGLSLIGFGGYFGYEAFKMLFLN
jgi:threonine/homoserine/homoserine lactone efflux protein